MAWMAGRSLVNPAAPGDLLLCVCRVLHRVVTQIKDKRGASPDGGNGTLKTSKALAAGFGLGDAYSAVQGGEIVGLMAKVMKVCRDTEPDRWTYPWCPKGAGS